MTPQTIETRIQQARSAWLNRDGQAFADLFTPTGLFIAPGHRWRGRAEILRAFQGFTAEATVQAIEIHNLVIQDDRAMVEWTWTETSNSTGQTSTAADAIAIDVQGGLIQRWREYIDTAPPPAGPG